MYRIVLSGHTLQVFPGQKIFAYCNHLNTRSGEGLGMRLTIYMQVSLSLVPRLPHSGMRTLKLCRRGEPGIFCHVKSAKDRREVDTTLIVRRHMRFRTEKGTKVADNLLHISSYRALNNIHTER